MDYQNTEPPIPFAEVANESVAYEWLRLSIMLLLLLAGRAVVPLSHAPQSVAATGAAPTENIEFFFAGLGR